MSISNSAACSLDGGKPCRAGVCRSGRGRERGRHRFFGRGWSGEIRSGRIQPNTELRLVMGIKLSMNCPFLFVLRGYMNTIAMTESEQIQNHHCFCAWYIPLLPPGQMPPQRVWCHMCCDVMLCLTKLLLNTQGPTSVLRYISTLAESGKIRIDR